MARYVQVDELNKVVSLYHSAVQIDQPNIILVNDDVGDIAIGDYVVITDNCVSGIDRKIGTSPTDYHFYDYDAGGWIFSASEAKEKLGDLVNNWRDRKINEPIEYLGIVYDANENAQRNISSYLTMINAGVQLPESFYWRDFNNVDRPVDVNWLIGISAYLIARGNSTYVESWRMKLEIENLETEQEILQYFEKLI